MIHQYIQKRLGQLKTPNDAKRWALLYWRETHESFFCRLVSCMWDRSDSYIDLFIQTFYGWFTVKASRKLGSISSDLDREFYFSLISPLFLECNDSIRRGAIYMSASLLGPYVEMRLLELAQNSDRDLPAIISALGTIGGKASSEFILNRASHLKWWNPVRKAYELQARHINNRLGFKG